MLPQLLSFEGLDVYHLVRCSDLRYSRAVACTVGLLPRPIRVTTNNLTDYSITGFMIAEIIQPQATVNSQTFSVKKGLKLQLTTYQKQFKCSKNLSTFIFTLEYRIPQQPRRWRSCSVKFNGRFGYTST
jgi:hypothetical protein